MSQASLPHTIEDFFRAMQAGASGETELLALFHEDAEYVEPFSGKPQSHKGIAAIRETFVSGWRHPLPEMRLEVDRFDLQDGTVRVDWTCYSPALPGGKGQGTNVFTLQHGLIVRLVTMFRG
jgi:hypothetical protein